MERVSLQILLNIVQSQIAWFAAVLGAAHGHPWFGTTVALLMTLIYVVRAKDWRSEAILALAAGAIGTVGDSILAMAGLLTFASGTVDGFTAPWMVALWINFATVLNGALRSLQDRTLALSCAIGIVAGPVAYASGVRLGAIRLPSLGMALVYIAIEWGIALPLLMFIARRLKRAQRGAAMSSWVILLLAVSASLPAVKQARAADNDSRVWSFQVSVDGHPLGRHDFILKVRDGVEQLESTALFEYKVAFVRLYRYQHEAHETWKDKCLSKLSAETDDNGTHQTVHGELQGNGAFQIESSQAPKSVKDCVRSFAYWDLTRLKSDHLLNPQTGRYEEARLELLGPEAITLSGKQLSLNHYRLHASAAGPIELWYSDTGDWLRLQSKTQQGKTVTYERAL